MVRLKITSLRDSTRDFMKGFNMLVDDTIKTATDKPQMKGTLEGGKLPPRRERVIGMAGTVGAIGFKSFKKSQKGTINLFE